MTYPHAAQHTPAQTEHSAQQAMGAPPRPGLIVGIGASAGGLEAFETFFTHMPPDSGMAFVLVQHLDPQQPSLLPELLAPHTQMPVRAVADRTPVAADHVYLIPPNTTLTIDQGVLLLATPTEARGHRLPIDHFFRSLAADQGDRAVGIVLSGSGTDGTLGLMAVKEHGGMSMAQAPDSARYDAMPRSAIARGLVDYVLPVAQLPAALLAYLQHGMHSVSLGESDPSRTEAADGLRPICAILRRETGHDFSHYKPGTLRRRIARRMQVLHVDTLGAYVERLGKEPQEVARLFQDLLISVTHFFRDPAAFETLASTVIPELLRNKSADAPLRVWVPGCASGEEAYSIAILLQEQLSRLEVAPQVQVFATDIDEQALDVARQGRYAESVVEHVSAERLARFFVKEGHSYQVTRAIRDLCLFSAHNLISDPPFARLDLIACRNLLIYLDADLQKKLVPLLHYALVSHGYLLLGASESVATHSELFQVVDKQHRIFQRKDPLIRPYVDFPLAKPGRRPLKHYGAVPRVSASQVSDIGKTLERLLLAEYAPPAVIINERHEIVYFSGHTGAYLEPPAGAASLDILAMAHPDLRLALHATIRIALRDRAPTLRENLVVETTGGVQRLNLIVRPLTELGADAGLLLVIFQDSGPAMDMAQAHGVRVSPPAEDSIARQLAQELQTTREALQTTIEDLEASNADLRTANEELLSFNEELQSANEELQTSKEEIQSINEELQTVNAELSRKIEELDRVNGDLQNLFTSTQIPAIFLYADGCIARFTPAATAVFRLIATDIGRPITDIAPRFRDGDLATLVAVVLQTLTPHEEQVHRLESDTWWIMRIQPYRTLGNVIDGVVITFSDITNLKRAEAERERLLESVQQARIYAEQIVETVREPLLIIDANLRVQAANRAFYATFQATPAETEQTLLPDLGGGQWDIPQLRALLGAVLTRDAPLQDFEVTQAFPHMGARTMLLNARRIAQAPDRAPLILLAMEDITERKQAASDVQQAHDVLEARVRERTGALAAANAALQAEISEHMRAEHARQQLLRQLVTAQEEERRRIARELHDQMGQNLTALLLGLKTLREAPPGDVAIPDCVEQLQALARQMGREVRTLALQLRPPALDDLGLVAVLESYVEEWSARALVAVDFHTIGMEEQRLPAPIETALYRLIQEALTNVLNHAQATSVSLIIERHADAVRMIVEDDGVGFDVAAVMQSAPAERRLGLIGMDERVAQLGGTLTLESAPGSGTTLFVHIPFADDAQGGSDGDTPDLPGR